MFLFLHFLKFDIMCTVIVAKDAQLLEGGLFGHMLFVLRAFMKLAVLQRSFSECVLKTK